MRTKTIKTRRGVLSLSCFDGFAILQPKIGKQESCMIHITVEQRYTISEVINKGYSATQTGSIVKRIALQSTENVRGIQILKIKNTNMT